MKKVVLLIIIYSLFVSLSYGDSLDDKCVYRPAYFTPNSNTGTGQISLGSQNISGDLQNGLFQVFRYYGKFLEESDGKLLMDCTMYSDFEVLVSYTKKATDKRWLSQHNKEFKDQAR